MRRTSATYALAVQMQAIDKGQFNGKLWNTQAARADIVLRKDARTGGKLIERKSLSKLSDLGGILRRAIKDRNHISAGFSEHQSAPVFGHLRAQLA